MLLDWLWVNIVYYWNEFTSLAFWPLVDWFKENVAAMILAFLLVSGFMVYVLSR